MRGHVTWPHGPEPSVEIDFSQDADANGHVLLGDGEPLGRGGEAIYLMTLYKMPGS